MKITRRQAIDLFIAFILALSAWFIVNGQEKIDTWVDVGVEFKGIPPELFVSDGMINNVNVRVRGTRGRIAAITSQHLYFTVDLKGIVKGVNIIHIDQNVLPLKGALEIVDITPSTIELNADIIKKVERKLVVQEYGELPDGLVLDSLSFTPETVTLVGPENILEGIKDVKVPIQLDSLKTASSFSVIRNPVVPPSVEITPKQVSANFVLKFLEKEVSFSVKPVIKMPTNLTGNIKQKSIKITLSMPEIYKKADELEEIEAILDLSEKDNLLPNTSVATDVVLRNVPEWAKIVEIEPKKIFVFIKERKPENETFSEDL
ncbi:CdaR family protein [Desulfovibrio litoralis]|uniref:YbbR-like protein n=1 Tax=Desulfovibrio litoralis DSM 11393 TaxID=1121455 RepID=A0A1M7TQI2_9BACT|nr:CdaR family protein [Desulfovibrio litoralis]SHN73001.1 YbbR-like protein [Desulfovibrio litoralis DSM 11393]